MNEVPSHRHASLALANFGLRRMFQATTPEVQLEWQNKAEVYKLIALHPHLEKRLLALLARHGNNHGLKEVLNAALV
jgi:hypothetical protein